MSNETKMDPEDVRRFREWHEGSDLYSDEAIAFAMACFPDNPSGTPREKANRAETIQRWRWQAEIYYVALESERSRWEARVKKLGAAVAQGNRAIEVLTDNGEARWCDGECGALLIEGDDDGNQVLFDEGEAGTLCDACFSSAHGGMETGFAIRELCPLDRCDGTGLVETGRTMVVGAIGLGAVDYLECVEVRRCACPLGADAEPSVREVLVGDPAITGVRP